MLARLQGAGRRRRGRREPHQELVDAAHDLLLAAGDLGSARGWPAVETAERALLEKHPDHPRWLFLAQEQREPPPPPLAHEPAACLGHPPQLPRTRAALAR